MADPTLTPLLLNWIAPAKDGGRGEGTKPAREACSCTGRCGDDARLAGGLVAPCLMLGTVRKLEAELRAATAGAGVMPELLHGALQQLADVLHLMDHMEPDTPDADRADDEQWDIVKAGGYAFLLGARERLQSSGLTADSFEARTTSTTTGAEPQPAQAGREPGAAR